MLAAQAAADEKDRDQRRDAVTLWGNGFDSGALSEIDEPLQAEIVARLPPEHLERAGRELESDKAVDFVQELEADQRQAVLAGSDDAGRVAAERSLELPEASAGRLMQREIVIVPEHWNAGQAIDFLRSSSNLPEQFRHLLLTEPRPGLPAWPPLGA